MHIDEFIDFIIRMSTTLQLIYCVGINYDENYEIVFLAIIDVRIYGDKISDRKGKKQQNLLFLL